MSSCQVECLRTATIRVQFPAAAPILHRLRVSTRPSLQNSAYSGRHGGSLPFSFGVVADKQCTCPASKLMWERYPPTPPAFARSGAAGEGCRAVVPQDEGGPATFCRSRSWLRLATPISLRETRPMHREKPHKLLQVGVTPTPATNYLRRATKEVIRLPDCKLLAEGHRCQ